MRQKGEVPEAKKKAALQLAQEIGKRRVVAVADLHKVRSFQVTEIRRKMRGKVDMLVTKNTLIRKAAEMAEDKRKNITKFAESLSGPSLFLLTDMNPYELENMINKNKVRVAAKGGDIAESDILVNAGNTGLSPGPVISEFSESKIPTRIEGGSIYISKDTVVVRKGEEISPKLASVLSKLGMKPMEAGLRLVLAYDEGVVLNEQDLKFDISEYQDMFNMAAKNAQLLAVEASYVTPQTAPMILTKAQRQAIFLSLESEYPAVDTVPEMLRTSFLEMKALSEQLAARNKDAAPSSYEAPPAVVEAPKLEVTPPPSKPKPAAEIQKERVTVVEEAVQVQPVSEEKPQHPKKPVEAEEISRPTEVIAAVKEPEAKVAIGEKPKPKVTHKRKPTVAPKEKTETKKPPRKRTTARKEKAKRERAKSP